MVRSVTAASGSPWENGVQFQEEPDLVPFHTPTSVPTYTSLVLSGSTTTACVGTSTFVAENPAFTHAVPSKKKTCSPPPLPRVTYKVPAPGSSTARAV